MMVAGALGAFGGAVWTARHAHPDHRPSFSVLAFADQGRGPAEFDNGLARLDGQLTVVNAGPAPIIGEFRQRAVVFGIAGDLPPGMTTAGP
jgi:hypothetical protein